jgi:hypothetical protein
MEKLQHDQGAAQLKPLAITQRRGEAWFTDSEQRSSLATGSQYVCCIKDKYGSSPAKSTSSYEKNL